MPINRARQAELRLGALPADAEELSFLFTRDALQFLAQHGDSPETHAKILGAFERSKADWYTHTIGRAG